MSAVLPVSLVGGLYLLFVELHHALDKVGGRGVRTLVTGPVRLVVQGPGGQQVASGAGRTQEGVGVGAQLSGVRTPGTRVVNSDWSRS